MLSQISYNNVPKTRKETVLTRMWGDMGNDK